MATSAAISLSAVDYWGQPIALNATSQPGGQGWIVTLPPQEATGYYELTATAGGTSGCLQYAVVPSSAPDKRFGVVTQVGFSNPVGLETAVVDAGMGAVKDGLSWQSAVTAVSGPLSVPTTFDTYMSMLARDGITPLLALAFDNSLYEPGGSGPFTLPFGNLVAGQSDIAGFAAYAAGLASRYANPGLSVAIWNEVDGSFCQGPACGTQVSRAAAYSTLSKTASSALRAHGQSPPIVGGASYGINLPWFESLFYTGTGGTCPSVLPNATPSTNALLGAIDQIDIHWYSRAEDLDQALQDLTTLTSRCGGKPKPIVATEFGAGDWRFAADGYQTAVHESANELVKDAAVFVGRGAAAMYWYVLNDVTIFVTGDPENMLQSENNNQLYVPTPAYAAYANFIAQMAEAVPQSGAGHALRGNVAPDNRSKIYAFKSSVKATQLYVAWAVPEMLNADVSGTTAAHVSFKATGATTITNVMGQQVASYKAGSSVNLTLTASPVYIGIMGANNDPTFKSTDTKLLASSADDFGTAYPGAVPTTGQNGWSYGYIRAPSGTASSVALGFQAGFQSTTWSDGSWIAPGSDLVLSRTNQAPVVGYLGTAPLSVWAVRRWTCPSAGPACSVAISGQAQLISPQSAGVTVLVVANDQVQFAANLIPANGVAPGTSIGSPSNAGAPLLVTVQPGAPIDFAVTTGPGAFVQGYDATTLYVWIANTQ